MNTIARLSLVILSVLIPAAPAAIIVPGSDGPLAITGNSTIDLAQALTGGAMILTPDRSPGLHVPQPAYPGFSDNQISPDVRPLSIWGNLLEMITRLRAEQYILDHYPKYASIATDFSTHAPIGRVERFARRHEAGDKRSARAVLRKFAGY